MNTNTAYSVRLGVSMDRKEQTSMRRRFGSSHTVRLSSSLGPWEVSKCSCHNLQWATPDLNWNWADGGSQTCPMN